MFSCSVSSRSPLGTGVEDTIAAVPDAEFCAAVARNRIAVFGECTVIEGEREPNGERAIVKRRGCAIKSTWKLQVIGKKEPGQPQVLCGCREYQIMFSKT